MASGRREAECLQERAILVSAGDVPGAEPCGARSILPGANPLLSSVFRLHGRKLGITGDGPIPNMQPEQQSACGFWRVQKPSGEPVPKQTVRQFRVAIEADPAWCPGKGHAGGAKTGPKLLFTKPKQFAVARSAKQLAVARPAGPLW